MKLNDDLSFGETGLVLKSSAVEQNPQFKKISDQYAEHAKLVFLFDVSGSMNSQVAYDQTGASYADAWLWTAQQIADIGAKVGAVVSKLNTLLMSGCLNAMEQLSSEEVDALRLADDQKGPSGEFQFTPADDEDIKARVVRCNLTDEFGIAKDYWGRRKNVPTRMEIVRKLAKQEIAARFKKYPSSRIAVLPFGTYTVTMFDDGTPEAIDEALDKLSTDYEGTMGGTDIISAIGAGLEVCRQKPSIVGIHHFILVTDGEDGRSQYEIASWVPALKASGVVLDYIHIGDLVPNAGLQAACKALGGEYVTVNSVKDIEEKFVQAVNRLCLPPATV